MDRGCDCRNFAPLVQQVLELFYGDPEPEPEGLGAVVVNPFTDGVWVRSAHPALPWYDPAADSSQQWSDPTCESWFNWADLPRPLVTQSPGWTPAALPEARDRVAEPTGIGAVVEASGESWIRVRDGKYPWFRPNSGSGVITSWEELDQPVRVRSHGWIQR